MKNVPRLLALAPVAALLTACPAPPPAATNNAAAPANSAAENSMNAAVANEGNAMANAGSPGSLLGPANTGGPIETRSNDDRRRTGAASTAGH